MNIMAQWLNRLGIFPRRKEKIEITVETKESWEINLFRQSRTDFCPRCKSDTVFIPPDLGVRIVGDGIEKIEDLMKSGAVHFTNTPEKLVCLSSLKNEFESPAEKTKIVKNGN